MTLVYYINYLIGRCKNDCSFKGQCDTNLKCKCNNGYSGEDCSENICPKECSKNGECTKEGCKCNPGYMGEDCSLKSCPEDCNENGECDFKTGKCACTGGYVGDSCKSKICINNCNNNGECNEGTCKCKDDYDGYACEISIINI